MDNPGMRLDRTMTAARTAAAFFAVAGCLSAGGCYDEMAQYTSVDQSTIGGNAQSGAVLIRQFGCGSCHTVPGISGADGLVGPPLTQMARRVYIAGVLRNSPDNMIAWLQDPQAIVSGNAMPRMGIDRNQAQDIAAYLYTLR
jgi:cytochrome c2